MFKPNEIKEIIGVKNVSDALLRQAFTRKSYSEENGGVNNEVLEFVGDKVLDILVVNIMMERFARLEENRSSKDEEHNRDLVYVSDKSEGELTNIKIDLVEKKALSNCIRKHGLNKYLIMGNGDMNNHVEEEDSVMEDLFEAIIGAYYIHNDYDLFYPKVVLEKLIDFDAYFESVETNIDKYTGIVQEWAQKRGFDLPSYSYKELEKGYEVEISIPEFNISVKGKGYNKKEGRKDAAKNLYMILKNGGYLINKFEEAVGKPIYNESIRQVNELYAKGLISKPEFDYHDLGMHNGVTSWMVGIFMNGGSCYPKIKSSKKEAQKECCFAYLNDLMDIE